MTPRCAISSLGYLFTNFELADKDVVLLCRAYNPEITLDTLPDKFFLAFAYYALHRHHIDDPNKSNYYLAMHEREWSKVRNPNPAVYTTALGNDL